MTPWIVVSDGHLRSLPGSFAFEDCRQWNDLMPVLQALATL